MINILNTKINILTEETYVDMQLTTSNGEVFNVYIVGPKQANKGILLIHDWWGVLDYNHKWADRFVELGYRVLIIDLLDNYHPSDVKEASDYLHTLDQEVANRKLQAALAMLHSCARKVAILGWSFGGVQAQYAALQNPERVDAIVLYYCRIIIDKHKATTLKCPVLAIFAETERTWPDKQAALEHAMSETGKILECRSYDASHGFVNPDSLRYDGDITEESWRTTVAFLNKYLS